LVKLKNCLYYLFMLRLLDSISLIPDLNLAQKRAIAAFGAKTVGDLVEILPRRYDDYTNTVAIRRAPLHEPVTLKVTIEKIANQPGFRKRIAIIRASVKDQTGTLRVIWFNQPWLLEELKPGREIFLSGTVVLHPRFGRQMSNPIWEDVEAAIAAGTIAPVYPLTGSVAQKTMREMMAKIVDDLEEIPEVLPKDLAGRPDVTLDQAFRLVHRPVTIADSERGRGRLAFDEFLVYRLALGSARKEADAHGAPVVAFDQAFAKKFVAALSFPLTADQKRAAWAAMQDMEKPRPMRRLLQGDVGSGKTAVAAFLLAMSYRSGQSAVMMAPTEILTQQHFTSIRRLLEVEGAPILLLTSSSKVLWEGGEEKKINLSAARDRIAEGRIVVVGTHSLLERGMMPPDAALAVVDEQHRFGVAQREALSVAARPDGKVPHLLSMTATPIPRSLSLTLYGDLDISVIRTKPAGRREIKTTLLVGEDRDAAYATVKKEVAAGHRAFIVCPLIDPSDTLGVKSATDEAKRLASGPLKGLRIGLLHGRLSNADKDGVMRAFADGLLDVLVATTVVEVGVDVPEATVILIEAAERFGMAQLHQLRGRVGRSSFASHCYLLTDTDDPDVMERLNVLVKTNDGFIIAEEDLKRRGSGNILGTQQSGRSTFRAARPWDTTLMVAAGEAAKELLEKDPALASAPAIAARVEEARKTDHQE
jgi:ATP-dependent DNA helicase RecG